jgi:hypothetical protein
LLTKFIKIIYFFYFFKNLLIIPAHQNDPKTLKNNNLKL